MSRPDVADWTLSNQQLLGAELDRLRHRLAGDEPGEACAELDQAVADARAAMPAPSALDRLAEAFGLSGFERELVLLCCGIELDARLAIACAEAQGVAGHCNASFAMAMSLLPEPHWSALTPARPLRRWRLLEMEPGQRRVDCPLRVDERILHYVAGINTMDIRLQPQLSPRSAPGLLAGSHSALVSRLVQRLEDPRHAGEMICLEGNDPRGQLDAFAAAAAALGCLAFCLQADELPTVPADLELLQVLWERESRLLPAMLLVHTPDAPLVGIARRFCEQVQAKVFIAGPVPQRFQRACASFTVDKPLPVEQKQLWQLALGRRAAGLNGSLDALAGQFRISAGSILEVAANFEPVAVEREHDDKTLWQACRKIGRDRLESLAQRIEPAAGWDDLVLPPGPQGSLRQIAAHLRQRIRVYEQWGFAGKGQRGLGVSALFCGESGTGKTLAAEVLANELQLDLYRIDLSAVVSKYIGETEKNLRRVFDAAEESGAILLFDEADALFGKRSEVKDSHDRYANIEVSYLLQRMEAYRGLAVLTSNMKSALDRAFQRRLRFIINFPFPDSALREEIWRRVFPSATPVVNLDYSKLARLNLPGGSVRNIALQAAFIAADAGEPVRMQHLLRAAHSEYSKLERSPTDSEVGGWA